MSRNIFGYERPVALTMWDFSWLERRWPGAGYEDWDAALDGLAERGYDAVRIDAYPHFIADRPEKERLLLPEWNTQCWGSPYITKVRPFPALTEFICKCSGHGIKVCLSTWFRDDGEHVRMGIGSPEEHAGIWIRTLDLIKKECGLDNILCLDLCNEFPNDWAPFFAVLHGRERGESAVKWMKETAELVRREYPAIPLTFSSSPPFDYSEDVSAFDFLDMHIWMANSCDYYDRVGYHYERFDDSGYDNLMLRGREEYFSDRERYDAALVAAVTSAAGFSEKTGRPLMTSECWSLVDYKDAPLLDWDWIFDLNRLGIKTALGTGRWAALATSNFCGPQFRGMWDNVAWHREMTDLIKNA